MDRGAWWAAAHGAAKSWTRLKRLSSSSSSYIRTASLWLLFECLNAISSVNTALLNSLVERVVKNLPTNAGDVRDLGLIPASGTGSGIPLQYSCLKNPMNREAWRATVHRVTKIWTWLKQLSTHKTHQGLPRPHCLPLSLARHTINYFFLLETVTSTFEAHLSPSWCFVYVILPSLSSSLPLLASLSSAVTPKFLSSNASSTLTSRWVKSRGLFFQLLFLHFQLLACILAKNHIDTPNLSNLNGIMSLQNPLPLLSIPFLATPLPISLRTYSAAFHKASAPLIQLHGTLIPWCLQDIYFPFTSLIMVSPPSLL